MKQLMIITAIALYSLASFAADPNPKVLNTFHSTFRYAKDVVWGKSGNYIEASFILNDTRYKMMYDEEGHIVNAYRYYGEQGLPILVRSGLEKRFAGMKVFGVTEVTNNKDVAYYIVLEDQTTWINVKADSYGTVRVESKYRKTEAPAAVAQKGRLSTERQAYNGDAFDGLY